MNRTAGHLQRPARKVILDAFKKARGGSRRELGSEREDASMNGKIYDIYVYQISAVQYGIVSYIVYSTVYAYNSIISIHTYIEMNNDECIFQDRKRMRGTIKAPERGGECRTISEEALEFPTWP